MSAPRPDIVKAARGLLDRTDPATAGLWPRATALLGRQAIEGGLADLWKVRRRGGEVMRRAQLVAAFYLRMSSRRASRVRWSALSRACTASL